MLKDKKHSLNREHLSKEEYSKNNSQMEKTFQDREQDNSNLDDKNKGELVCLARNRGFNLDIAGLDYTFMEEEGLISSKKNSPAPQLNVNKRKRPSSDPEVEKGPFKTFKQDSSDVFPSYFYSADNYED